MRWEASTLLRVHRLIAAHGLRRRLLPISEVDYATVNTTAVLGPLVKRKADAVRGVSDAPRP
jgi:hypothetical protein